MIVLVNSGVGNLRSVEKAFEAVGADIRLTADPAELLAADKVILPGVGSFGNTMNGLEKRGLVDPLRAVIQRRKPLLGICVGMQVLFDESDELGLHKGLGFFPGRVRRFEGQGLKIPETGWNQIEPMRDNPLFSNLLTGSYAYFNHSYYCDAFVSEDVLAVTEYGIRYASAVNRDNVYGVQFHPEKSQAVGLKVLRNFVELC
jgi:glutamine amidotransferase